METSREPTFWEMLNPRWMFRCRPEDFRPFGEPLCLGVFWLQGMIGLLLIHVVCFASFWTQWRTGSDEAFMTLVPLVPLWLWFFAADVKFRLQKPTRDERARFDNAVVNWFGFALTVVGYGVVLPVAVVLLLWRCFS